MSHKKNILKIISLCFMCFILAMGLVINEMNDNAIMAAESTLIIHYSREDKEYDGWNLWIQRDGESGEQVDFTEEDKYGEIAIYKTKSPEKIGFIVRRNQWDEKDIESDRFVEVKKGVTEIWIASGKEEVWTEHNQTFVWEEGERFGYREGGIHEKCIFDKRI